MNEHFADPLDRAVAEQEALLNQQLRAARQKPEILPFTGSCYNCSEGLEPGHRFCDTDCRDDYEARKRSRAQKVY